MISLETVADDGLDIYAAMAGVTFSNLPSAPSTHKILVKITLTNLAESATRNLRVKATTAGDTYLIYTDHYISLTNGDADDVLVCQIGPFVYGVGPDLDVTIGSDNAGDTEVDVEITVFSDDPEYYLTCRAAETTPTANSLTARIKAIDTNTGGLGGAAMRGTDGANTVVPDAAGVVATALGLLETHGDDTWATATSTTVSDKTGFKLASDGLASVTAWTVNLTGNLSGSVGSVTTKTGYSLVSTGLDLVTAWTTDITGDITGNLSGSVGSVTTKTGYVLAATGLDSITTTGPTNAATNFREMIVQVWRRFFKKSTLTSSALVTFADDGSTPVTTQAISDDGTTETQGAATTP